MLKRIFYKAVFSTVIISSLSACNKYLDLQPPNGITSNKFWKTKEDLQGAVIGIYTTMSGGGPVSAAFMWGELRADFLIATPFASRAAVDVMSHNILPTNALADWSPIYRVINLCNTVIELGPKVKEIDATLTQTQLENYLGEAYAIRALMYFYLARTFGDVPLKLKASITDDDIVDLAKSNQQEVLNQILSDLTIAENFAAVTYGNVNHDKGRITKWAVNAMQADVYLWMDRYEDCIEACQKVRTSGKFTLVEGDDNWFRKLYIEGNSVESIFEIQYETEPTNRNTAIFNLLNAANKSFLGNTAMLETFYTTDLIDPDNKDIRGEGVAINSADGIVYKYFVTNVDQMDRNWIYYRYADILLMQAEAYANSGRGQAALDIIEVIRARANALPGSALLVGPTDVNGITNYLVAERAREFAYEGKRWFDLLRNAKRNDFERIDILQDAAVRSVPAVSLEAAIAKMQDENSLYLPIYFTEIQRNKKLVQNPYYK